MTRLSRRDAALIAACIALASLSIFIIARYYYAAFPVASVDFRLDRNSSRPIAERLLASQHFDARAMKHAARFDSDDNARIFLERSIGLKRANQVMRDRVRLFYWHHRWFKPLQEEEVSVDVAPTGEVVAFNHKIPEERAIADSPAIVPADVLRAIGVRIDDLTLITTSERRLPHRVQRIYTWESKSIRPAGAPYRHTLIIDGNVVTGYSQRVKVPDAWLRSYGEMRSKNIAAGLVDLIFNAATMIAALVIFVVRLRRGDLQLRFLIAVGIATVILTAGTALNSMPAQFADYDTNSSYSAFVGNLAFSAAVQALGAAMLLIVICGSGEVLYRERMPGKLAIPRLWNRTALASRRVFLSLILGYTLVPLFIAYQVVFYLYAEKHGAWAPAEVQYDELLNSALPWIAVLFAGFFPALSEEFLSRAFSIPFFERIFRSRIAAIVLAAFIWGFGHAAYPNQPFYIRGLEVGIVGIIAGTLMLRFGLLPLLIWHFTVDAVYTATLLFTSGNAYYVASAAASSLIFLGPLIAAVVLYVRNRGFVPDEDLSNATLPIAPAPAHPEVSVAAAQFPVVPAIAGKRVLACVAAVIIAAIAFAFRPPAPDDAIDYRITKERAKEIARAFLQNVQTTHIIAAPVEGFRSWDRESSREDGGAPGNFDSIAASYLLRNGVSMRELANVFRTRIEAGTWSVRFFTPMKKEEYFVEVDPRTSRVIGFHKYQEERNPGASLTESAAVAIARNAFATYGIDQRAFDLKESLTFLQPNRRDWLFHFEERTPIAARAFRRVTVRVAGAEVTQFNKNVKIPDSVYREATATTFLNVILFAMKIIGAISLLALVVAGIVIASRARGLPWRRALRWTLILSIIPIAAVVARSELSLFGYSTAMAWETFRVRLATEFVINVAKEIGILFLALAGLEASIPYALSLATREGRARFGRGAAIATLTALSIFMIADVVLEWIEIRWPAATSINISVPEAVAIPLPAFIDGAQALIAAIIVAGAVAMYNVALRKFVAPITITSLFFVTVDPSVTTSQAPLMLLRALAIALLVWFVARYVLDANPLAWPLVVFVAYTLQSASVLLPNHRPDLIANGVALIAIALAAIVWAALPRSVDA